MSCIVEQGTKIRYVLPVRIQNVFGQSFFQEIVIELELDGKNFKIEYESTMDYRAAIGKGPEFLIEVIDEKVV